MIVPRWGPALASAAAAAVLAGCSFGPSGDTTGQPPNLTYSPSPLPSPSEDTADTGAQVLAKGLRVPWGVGFLPDGSALVTERDTHRILRVTAGGRVTPVQTVPGVVSGGEGGLLGLAVSPRYTADRTVYVYYTTARDNRIAKLVLGSTPVPILTGIPAGQHHDGGRIAFGPDGYLYAGTGDAGVRGTAQDPRSLGGKILRMTTDGGPAPGNPRPRSVVWSLGHRNVQGLAWDAAKRMYATEFGQNRFDELNRIEPGENYGWPAVEGTGGGSRFTDPLVTWPTDEASPSGLAIGGDVAVLACLRGERLYAVQLDPATGRPAAAPQAVLVNRYGRLRTVAAAPDGSLWVTTSNRDGRGRPTADDDRILRIVPPGGGGVSVL
ncbi:MAG TPA: PQQ-dependent sugar dehydrogenase [Mycobacteriales bacterium]|jgi:glucose/arabinose dehydrogenase